MLLLFGTAYVFSTPPGAVADEPAHLAKIIVISEGMPFGGQRELLPLSVECTAHSEDYLKNKAAFTENN